VRGIISGPEQPGPSGAPAPSGPPLDLRAVRATPGSGPAADHVAGVHVDHLEKIAYVFREKFSRVLAANRFFEEETGLHNEVGHNNLNDALSHLGSLFEGADKMDYEQQGHEVHDLEGHLRRSMMESYELVVRQRLGQIAELWEKHDRLVRPLQERGELEGLPPLDQLSGLRVRIRNLINDGRGCKRGHDWDEWEKGTDHLIDACRTASELHDKLGAGLRAAEQHRNELEARERAEQAERKGSKETDRGIRAGVRTTVIASIVTLILGGFIGYGVNALGGDDPKQAQPRSPVQPGDPRPGANQEKQSDRQPERRDPKPE
jgi:hypothetical protein